jgi:hypothetical protein
MILETFDKFHKSLAGVTEEHTGTSMLTKFETMGIPNFIIA